jgi:uncharacterized membrane protein YbhN (UPF0104 family)
MPTPPRSLWQRWGWLARWGGAAAGIAYIAHVIDVDEAKRAAAKISLGALAFATALVALNVACGALRWRILLAAYGARARPSLAFATRLYFEAFFFNNFLPGAVAGDVVRGVVARDAFGENGTTPALAVVFVERVLGLFGVFLLLAIGLGAAGRELDAGSLWLWSAIGIAGSFAVVLALPLSRAIAPKLPGPLAAIAGRIPTLVDPRAFALATLLSIATQALVAIAGWVLLREVAPDVGLGAALLLVPLAAATTFLPITVGGAGAREGIYITLGAQLFAMSKGDALAASLALWLAHLACGAIGGVLYLARRRG